MKNQIQAQSGLFDFVGETLFDSFLKFSYQKVDGNWMDLRILSAMTEEKQETIWIFSNRTKDTGTESANNVL